MAKNETVVMPQPPYSSDLASADLFLVSKLKPPMKEKRVATIEKIKVKSKQELLFRGCGKNAGISVAYLRGGYLEGDRIVIDK